MHKYLKSTIQSELEQKIESLRFQPAATIAAGHLKETGPRFSARNERPRFSEHATEKN